MTVVLLAGAITLPGCNRTGDVPPSDLERDLQAVAGMRASGLEMAPVSGSIHVVSEIEGGRAETVPGQRRAPSPSVRRPSTPRVAAARVQPERSPSMANPIVVSEPEVVRPASGESESTVPAVRPVAAPQGAGPAPAGGWKTIEQIAPRLPFPIKP